MCDVRFFHFSEVGAHTVTVTVTPWGFSLFFFFLIAGAFDFTPSTVCLSQVLYKATQKFFFFCGGREDDWKWCSAACQKADKAARGSVVGDKNNNKTWQNDNKKKTFSLHEIYSRPLFFPGFFGGQKHFIQERAHAQTRTLADPKSAFLHF